MTTISFILGSMLGGLIGIGFICCLQINRCNKQKEKNN